MNLLENKIVWTCESSLEDGYDKTLHRPYQVKLVKSDRGVWYGHCFNAETGEIDEDSNATCFIRDYNCFDSKREANDYYIKYLEGKIAELKKNLEQFKAKTAGE